MKEPLRNLIPQMIHDALVRQDYGGDLDTVSMFVDISGFTSLTEVLMQHRRGGAEVLTEMLEAIFGPPVREVYARGGFVPLYAGDAFMAIFPTSPDTSAATAFQALQAALSIQRFLAPQGQERTFFTPYGDFAIGVKVGLSAGPVRWAIPGHGGQYSFYFRGPAVDNCAQAQQVARRGEVVADGNALVLLRGRVETAPIAGTPYAQLRPSAFDAPAPPFRPSDLTRSGLAPFVPEAVLDLPVRAEFREICPVFVSFQEPDDDIPLHSLVTTALALAQRYGGYLTQVAFGDKGGILVLLFGAPLAYENNIERAAEFLLALRQQHRALRWRSGMTYGIAWTGIRGTAERCEYGAIGDVVNLAARMAIRADWGEMWASAPVYERLKGAYRLDALGQFQFKGKRGRLEAYRLVAKEEVSETVFYTGRMVGRERELSWLAERIQPILTGQFGGVISIHGEAGVGKSRLVHEVRRTLPTLLPQLGEGAGEIGWLGGTTEQILRQSLNPFKQLLRRYFDQTADLPMEENRARFDQILDALIGDLRAIGVKEMAHEVHRTRSFLGSLLELRWEGSLYEQLQPKFRLQNALTGFKALMQSESLRRPIVLLLEDLHWLDPDSRELFRFLTRDMAGYPLAILCTSRYQDDGSRVELSLDEGVPHHILDLAVLPPESIRGIAAQTLAGEVDDALAGFLVEKTGGNPFFTEQLVLDLRERGVLERCPATDGDPSLAHPAGDQEAAARWSIREEATEVPETVNAVLVARLDRLEAQVKEVVQTAAVLGREFEIQVLSRMLQNDPHLPAKVGRAESERIWVALAEMRYIFRHTLMRDAAYDMQLRARLRTLHRVAAAAIEQVYAANLPAHYTDLAYHYGRAEDRQAERRYARLAGEHAAARLAHAEAITHLSRALVLTAAQDKAERYALFKLREQVYDLQGDRQAQAQDLAALVSLATQLDESMAGRGGVHRAEVALRQANYAVVTSDYPTAITAVRETIDWARAAGTPRLEAAAYLQWGRVLFYRGDYRAARPCLEQALAQARATHFRQVEADSLRNLGNVCSPQGDYVLARTYFEQAMRIYREVGDRRGEVALLANLGNTYYLQGDYVQARVHYEQFLESSREIGDQRSAIWGLSNLGLLSYHLGDEENALAYSREVLQIAERLGERDIQGYALTHLGHTLARWGDLQGAAAAYSRAVTIRRELEEHSRAVESLAGLARVRLAEGRLAEALEIVQEILGLWTDRSIEGTDEPFWVQLTCFQVLQSAGDPRAAQVLETAYARLQERAARISDPDARRSFLENVAAHREIVALFAQGGRGAAGRGAAPRRIVAEAPAGPRVRELAEESRYGGPLVNREHELERLVRFAQPVFQGRFAGVAYIYGEAGLGKSRLAYALRQALAQPSSAGDCDGPPSGASPPIGWFLCPADETLQRSLNPFRHFLRRYLAQSAADAPAENKARFDHALDRLVDQVRSAPEPTAPQIAREMQRTRSFLGAMVDLRWEDSLYERLDPRLRFENMLSAFKTLILAESLRRPVVLQLEDLHWLDDDSHRLLRVLTRNISHYPLLILCTGRPQDDGSRTALPVEPQVPQVIVELSPLTTPDSRDLAAQFLGGEIDDELAAFLEGRAGGNPFSLEQVLLDLDERGRLKQAGRGVWTLRAGRDGEAPADLGQVLTARLERLERRIQGVLDIAAVLGQQFEVQVLLRLLRREADEPVLPGSDQVGQIQAVLEEIRYLFHHALGRGTAYPMQVKARRRRLHRLAAEAIEQIHAADLAPHYADLAYHYDRAEDGEQARRYARRAGERAAARFANAEALAHLGRAIELTPAEDAAERWALLSGRERILDLLGEREAQQADLESLSALLATLADPVKQAELALRQAQYAEATANYGVAAAAAQEAVERCQAALANSPEIAALLPAGHLAWGRVLWRLGDYSAAQDQLEQALALARAATLPQIEADSLRALGNVFFYQQDYTVVRDLWEQALEIFCQIGDRQGEGLTLNNLGIAARYQGDYVRAQEYYERSLRIKREIGDRRGEGQTLNNLGVVASLQGDYSAARTYYEESLGIRREIGDRQGEGNALNNLGGITEHQGYYAAAQGYYRQALSIYREIGDRQGEGVTQSNLAAVSRSLGAYTAAREHYDQALSIYREIGDRQGEAEVLAYLALFSHQQGDNVMAREHSQQALALARELGDRAVEGRALLHLGHALAGLGLPGQAGQSYGESLAIREEMAQHHLAVEVRAALARLALGEGETDRARAEVEAILAYLETGTLDGTDEPLRVYLTCAQVLRAGQDPRAGDVLATAYALLQERAARIPDEALRRSFLENVAVHREVAAACENIIS